MRAPMPRSRRLDRFARPTILAVGVLLAARAVTLGAEAPGPEPERQRRGRELFRRIWTPRDIRSRDGDGLGPVYNAESCAGCHHLGGTGGAGRGAADVELLSASAPGRGLFRSEVDALAALHPGFADATSLVLHRFGTDRRYHAWRRKLMGGRTTRPLQSAGGAGNVTLGVTRRNTPALFGVGRIDALPEGVLRAVAGRDHPKFPEVKGRLARLPDGRIGRLGWKAQVATLDEFVRSACANELGLEVPGQHQALDPLNPSVAPPGLDLTESDCADLVAYVAGLAPPTESRPALPGQARYLAAGRKTFEAIGCADCHVPDLGDVRGIYSDLLLHDMGRGLADVATYYGAPSEEAPTGPPPQLAGLAEDWSPDGERPAPPSVATSREWRTPPLWGLASSGPYLHDGRADTIDTAITAHDGEGAPAAGRFADLPEYRRKELLIFLRSLIAPGPRPSGRPAGLTAGTSPGDAGRRDG